MLTATAPAPTTTTTDVTALVAAQQRHFASGATLPLAQRKQALRALSAALKTYENDLLQALHADLGKSRLEGYGTELGLVQHEIRVALENLDHWVRPQRVPGPSSQFISSGRIYSQPYGVALIIAPWNYPVLLLLSPLVAALAAGNCVVLKPSEISAQTSAVLAALIRKTYHPQHVALVEGGVEPTTALLQQPFNYIFYTGSTQVGRVVMRAAAEQLIPVTLELGGKSPCIVAADVPLDVAARRIVWGKFVNAGQTCVAPDYLLVDARIKNAFVEAMKRSITAFYGNDPQQSPDYGRIVNARHHARLVSYLAQGTVVHGGQHDATTRYLAPTLVLQPDLHAPLMQDEIFGPILPILTYNTLDEALAFVNSKPRPLALYTFTRSKNFEQRVLAGTSAGGGCTNDCLYHLGSSDLPFGGIGPSGMGAYHGVHGYRTFSHQRSVLTSKLWLDLPFRYAPYTKLKEKIVRLFVR